MWLTISLIAGGLLLLLIGAALFYICKWVGEVHDEDFY